MTEYSAVLIPRNLGMRSVDMRGKRAMCIDASALPFFVEELIGQGAIHLAVDRDSSYYESVDSLPEVFRKRIRKIDKDHRGFAQLIGVMRPILEEVGARVTPTSINLPSSLPKHLCDAIADLFLRQLGLFILGIQQEIQVGVSLQQVMSDLDILASELSSADSRAHIAVMRQVFGGYETKKVETLTVRLASPEERLAFFREFVEDMAYKELSANSRLLGFPEKVDRALVLIRRLARQIVTKTPYKQALDLGIKGIQVKTQVPLPDSKMIQELIPRGYLPPLVSMGSETRSATNRWITAQPKFIPVARHKIESEEEGWMAIGDDSPETVRGGADAPLTVFHPAHPEGPDIDLERRVYLQVARVTSTDDDTGIKLESF